MQKLLPWIVVLKFKAINRVTTWLSSVKILQKDTRKSFSIEIETNIGHFVTFRGGLAHENALSPFGPKNGSTTFSHASLYFSSIFFWKPSVVKIRSLVQDLKKNTYSYYPAVSTSVVLVSGRISDRKNFTRWNSNCRQKPLKTLSLKNKTMDPNCVKGVIWQIFDLFFSVQIQLKVHTIYQVPCCLKLASPLRLFPTLAPMASLAITIEFWGQRLSFF